MKKFFGTLALSCVLLSGCDGQSVNSDEIVLSTDSVTTKDNMEEVEVNENESDATDITIEDNIITFVDEFNANNDSTLEYVEDFVPSNKQNPHYRTEFRLAAYENAIGKSYLYGNATVDIVVREDYFGDIDMRLYMDDANLQQCVDMINVASPIMDNTVTDDEVKETVNYIKENKEANGYYYADLGLLLLGNDKKGYEFMLETDK
ncbi:MAG: hypothetical protein E7267_02675 [Lachnospiraceae bacterium]|nr:hypothetical protein [Lachnospiraceae bacterium]